MVQSIIGGVVVFLAGVLALGLVWVNYEIGKHDE